MPISTKPRTPAGSPRITASPGKDDQVANAERDSLTELSDSDFADWLKERAAFYRQLT
jgi:hypothetical protein